MVLTLTNGATNPQTVTWNLYDASGLNNGDLTGYASPSSTTFLGQNGYPAGSLRGLSFDEDGVVTGSYSNGQLTPLFQLALAEFPSYYGLTKMGHNLYAESLESGQVLAGRSWKLDPSAASVPVQSRCRTSTWRRSLSR